MEYYTTNYGLTSSSLASLSDGLDSSFFSRLAFGAVCFSAAPGASSCTIRQYFYNENAQKELLCMYTDRQNPIITKERTKCALKITEYRKYSWKRGHMLVQYTIMSRLLHPN